MHNGSAAPLRVLLYSHDSLGLGHIRRNLALAHQLRRSLPRLTGRTVTGLLLTGAGHATNLDLPEGFDMVVLPGIQKGRGGYQPRHVDVPMADLTDVRAGMVAAALEGFAPDLVIIDRHAYGVDGELRGPLTALRRTRPQTTIVLGLREVLDDPAAVAREWRAVGDTRTLREIFDEIWVYGDPAVHDIRRTGELPLALRDLVHYTGYLATGRRARPWPGHDPFVLTMVGGGSDGDTLCRVAAQATVPDGHRHLVVTGPQMAPGLRTEIERLAGPRTDVVDFVPDGLSTIRGAAAVVSMAGYNTTCELMSTDTPALLVPREVPRLEQAIRARSLRAAGAVDVVRGEELTPQVLGGWLATATGRTQPRTGINLHGLREVAQRAAHHVGTHTRDLEVTHAAV